MSKTSRGSNYQGAGQPSLPDLVCKEEEEEADTPRGTSVHQSGVGQLVIALNIGTTQSQASGDDPRRRRQGDRIRHVHLIPVPDRVLITSHHETPVHINCITVKRMGSGPEGRGRERVFVGIQLRLVESPLRLYKPTHYVCATS